MTHLKNLDKKVNLNRLTVSVLLALGLTTPLAPVSAATADSVKYVSTNVDTGGGILKLMIMLIAILMPQKQAVSLLALVFHHVLAP